MLVPPEREIQVRAERLMGPLLGHRTAQHRPPEAGHDLDVAESGHAQIGPAVSDDRTVRERALGSEEELDQCRRVGDDAPQRSSERASLAARSWRMSSATGTSSFTGA